MSKRTKAKPRLRAHWRDYDDRFLPSRTSWPSPESLHPCESTVIRACLGEEEARAIIAAWVLVVPVRTVEVIG